MTLTISAFRSAMAALMAVLITATLAGCSGFTAPVAPALAASLSQASSSNPHHTFEETGYDNLNHYTESDPELWKNNVRAARAFGLTKLYNITGPMLYKTAYVGTFSKNCLVTISFDGQYYEKSLDTIPEYTEVAVFNRYGLNKFAYYNGKAVTYTTMKPFLSSIAKHCR